MRLVTLLTVRHRRRTLVLHPALVARATRRPRLHWSKGAGHHYLLIGRVPHEEVRLLHARRRTLPPKDGELPAVLPEQICA